MSWFKRVKDNIRTKTEDKNNTPDGLVGQVPFVQEGPANQGVEAKCLCMPQLQSPLANWECKEYFELLFDEGSF